MPQPPGPDEQPRARQGWRVGQLPPEEERAGAVGRLIALVVSAGLAWAITVALAAWLIGLLLSH